MMPPYWALGFQLCRWGYQNLSEIETVVNRTTEAGIPQDVQYTDIDYMDEYKIFTIDNSSAFRDLPNFAEWLHSQGKHYIIILDPGIDVTYDVFLRGKEADAYIHWPNGTDPGVILYNDQYSSTNGTDILLGRVWPLHHVAYPDFLSENGSKWWANELKMFHDRLSFDGLWIDMNEPSSFGTNNLTYDGLRCPSGQLDDPPYATWAAYFFNARLSDKTLCMAADQHGYEKPLKFPFVSCGV
jgi:alpha-glucosidase (family GH31 glycosyl hydrolase)